MIVKRFSQRILGTNGSFGFIRGRKYDMDLDRLGRMETAHRELSKTDDIRKEQREMRLELSRGLRWSDLKDDN
jgi:hypothetical protein